MVTSELKKAMFHGMLRLRRVEERIAILYREQQMRCPTHLYIGQEAVAVGACAALRKTDYLFGTYRGHGIYLAQGGNLNSMMAELYGKKTGSTRGKGGSMQLIAPEVGLLCTSALVGGTIPMSVGAALSAQLRKTDQVSMVVFGDGGTEEGVFHESLNFSALKHLPVIFICENNFYAVYTPFSKRQGVDNINDRAKVYGMPGVRVDGNSVMEVHGAVAEAVDRARRGGGPSLIECRTYRWLEHVGPNDDPYRPDTELKQWKSRCPLAQFQKLLLDERLLTESDISRMISGIDREIEESVRFAKESPFPGPEELAVGVYAS